MEHVFFNCHGELTMFFGFIITMVSGGLVWMKARFSRTKKEKSDV